MPSSVHMGDTTHPSEGSHPSDRAGEGNRANHHPRHSSVQCYKASTNKTITQNSDTARMLQHLIQPAGQAQQSTQRGQTS